MARIGTYSWFNELEEEIRVGDAGLDAVGSAVQEYLDLLNADVQAQLSMFAETSPDARRVWTGVPALSMEEVSEYGEAESQKDEMGSEVAFPLRKKSVTVGFTNDALKRMTAGRMRQILAAADGAYRKTIRDEISFAIYNPLSYFIKDRFGDGTTLKVKAALNGDDDDIPTGVDGTEFAAGAENHYHGIATLTAAAIDLLIADVEEHGGKGVTLVIPSTMVATLVALASTKFVKIQSNLLVQTGDAVQTVATFNPSTYDPNNATVGVWDGRYNVVTRRWAKANFIVCVATQESPKPILHRVDKFADLRGLVPAGDAYGLLPVFSKTWNAYHGMGILNRGAIAVLDTNSASYTAPTDLIRTVVDADA